ncbi:MAG: hypothetical protein R3D00_02780 [Bacteroidia bacterium]
MGLVRSPIFLLLLIFIALVVVLFRYRKHSRGIMQNIRNQFQEIESMYESLVKKRLSLSILEDRNPEKEKKAIAEEVMAILRPEIQLLIAHIQTQVVPDAKLGYSPRYFRLAKSLAENMVQRGSGQEISLSEIEGFFKAFEEGVQADISRRIIDLKTEARL